MTVIYVVMGSAYWSEDGSWVDSVFSTREKADAHIAKLEAEQDKKNLEYPESWQVEERVLDADDVEVSA